MPYLETKVPLKIEVLTWFLQQAVILTKDSLAKHRWHGSKKILLCDLEETNQHLFFSCMFVALMWCMIHVTCNLPPPTSITFYLEIGWSRFILSLRCISRSRCTLLWATWICRKTMVLRGPRPQTFSMLFTELHDGPDVEPKRYV